MAGKKRARANSIAKPGLTTMPHGKQHHEHHENRPRQLQHQVYQQHHGEQHSRQMAEEILADFAVVDHDSRDFLVDCIAHGHAPFADIRRMWSESLMHGFEAWEQLFACARGLQERSEVSAAHSGDGGVGDGYALEGTDLLGFVTRILNGREQVRREKSRRQQERPAASARTRHRLIGTLRDVDGRGASRKRGRAAVKKGSKWAAESHYWSANSEKEDRVEAACDSSRLGGKGRTGHCGEAINDQPRVESTEGTPMVAEPRESALGGCSSSDVLSVATAIAEAGPNTQRETMNAKQDPRWRVDSSAVPNIGNKISGASNELANGGESIVQNAVTPDSSLRPAVETTTGVFDRTTASQRVDTVSNTPVIPDINIKAQLETPGRVTRSSFFTTPVSTKPAPTPTLSALKTKSPRPPRGTVSCLPFPSLDVPSFGIAQERYTHDPFRLLIAVTFLIRTAGRVSMPVFRDLMKRYPTPQSLADANPAEIELMIRHLGLSNNRTATIQKYARLWEENPPRPGIRYGVKHYPKQGDGKDVKAGEKLEAGDTREAAWEIGHMTQGRYAIDSWRIFCRDIFLGRAGDNDLGGDGECDGTVWKSTKRYQKTRKESGTIKKGKNSETVFQPEWMRVLPEDKELRAYLRWMWMRERWMWDPQTGERTVLSREMYDAVQEGRVVWDNSGKLVIVPAGSDQRTKGE